MSELSDHAESSLKGKEELHAVWKNFVTAALGYLKNQGEHGSEIPETEQEEIVFDRPNTFRRTQVRKLEYNLFISLHHEGLTEIEEYKSLAKTMAADPIIAEHTKGEVTTIVGGIYRSIWDYATYPLIKQLSKCEGKFVFSEKLFTDDFLDLTRFFSSRTIRYLYVAPLIGFDSDADELTLEHGLKIRRMKMEENQRLMNDLRDTGFMPVEEVRFDKFCIELQLDVMKHFESWDPTAAELEAPSNIVARLVGSLRLFKAGDVRYNVINVAAVSDVPHLIGANMLVGHYRGFVGNSYVLDQTELTEFLSLRKLLTESTIPKVALTRFELAYDREQSEDRMIDYIISLEALFLRGEFSEMTHKLSLRVAKLLEATLDDRQRVYKEVKKLYGERSAIVHGGSTGPSHENLQRLEEIVRDSIKQLLHRLVNASHEELLTQLDLS